MRLRPGVLDFVRFRRLLRVALVTVVALGVCAPLTGSDRVGAAPGDPFAAGDGLVFVAQDDPTVLYQAVQGAGAITFVQQGGNAGLRYNAMSFHESDMFLYAMRLNSNNSGNNQLLRIGQSNVVTNLGAVSGLPLGNYNQGTFGTGAFADTLFVRDSSDNPGRNLFAVNINTRTATRITMSANVPNVSDIVWKDGFIWAVYGEGKTMYRINPTTGAVNAYSLSTLSFGAAPYGAQWVYGNGNIGISNNLSGNVFQISITNPTSATPTFAIVSKITGPESTNNDGAAYPGLAVNLQMLKSAPPTFAPGGPVTYTMAVTNLGPGNSSGYVINDSLPAGLTGVTSSSPGCTITDTDFFCAGGALANGATALFTFTGSTSAGAAACIVNSATVTGNEADPVASNNTSSATTCPGVTTAGYTVTKQASVASAVGGQAVTYTVTVTNTGDVAYTATSPATFSDDLSDVLDDATIDSASPGASVSGNTLSWEGSLDVGATVAVTYTVIVDDPTSGNGHLVNIVVPGSGGTCPTPAQCTTDVPIASFVVSKTADATTVVPGATITYTITIENTGAVDYTLAAPASFTDDLSLVIDDAVYNNDATGGATYAAPTLSWSGALAQGTTATVTYSLTVNDPGTGDGELFNAAVTPPGSGGNCPTGSTDPVCSWLTPQKAFTVTKTASAASALPGDTITYTITVTNTGLIAFTGGDPASFTDDLGDVLDDAALVGTPTNGATVDAGNVLRWNGALALAGTQIIEYTVQVADPDLGDRRLQNMVVPDVTNGGSCPTPADCRTFVPIQSYTVTKTATANPDPLTPGGVVEYTITVANTGAVELTAANPASLTDDLADVLDDATYVVNSATNGAVVTGATLSWEGSVPLNGFVEINYLVTVDNPDTGDHRLVNAVVPDQTGGGTCATPAACTTDLPVKSFTITKSASPAVAVAGGVVTYTITVTNTGQVDYTLEDPAFFVDDLTDVLDDVTFNNPVSNPNLAATNVTWSGPLAVGQTTTVTYSVTINNPDTGNHRLVNVVIPDIPNGGSCPTPAQCITNTPVRSFELAKTATPASAKPGDVVNYTVTVTNTGTAPYDTAVPASFTDNLAAVLDDAVYNNDATSGATVTASTLTWSGPLAVGATQTIRYSVTVKSPASGDRHLINAVTPPTNSGGTCPAACTTDVPVKTYNATKTVNATSAQPGDTLIYTITLTNTGAADFTTGDPATFTDDLSNVLTHSTYNNDATNGATYTAPVLSWSGPLPVGTTATVTYSITISPQNTASTLTNVVVIPLVSGGQCTTTTSTDPTCAPIAQVLAQQPAPPIPQPPAPAPPTPPPPSPTPFPTPLPTTGSNPGSIALVAGVLVAAGLLLLTTRRRTSRRDEHDPMPRGEPNA